MRVYWLNWEDWYKLESNTHVMNMLHLANKKQIEDVIDNYQTEKLETSEKLCSTEMGVFKEGPKRFVVNLNVFPRRWWDSATSLLLIILNSVHLSTPIMSKPWRVEIISISPAFRSIICGLFYFHLFKFSSFLDCLYLPGLVERSKLKLLRKIYQKALQGYRLVDQDLNTRSKE